MVHRKRLNIMEFNQIRYFLAVADTLNFTQAADHCAVSQPALSKAIRKLEDSLGAELFDRNAQPLALTPFGQTMRVHFERVEDSRRKAQEAAKFASHGENQRLDIGVMCTIGPSRFHSFLQHFQSDHPKVEITLHDIVAAHVEELLLGGSLDCVLCIRDTDHDIRFGCIDLFEEPMVVAFPKDHRFGTYQSVPTREIAKEPYLDRLHCEYREDFMLLTRASGLELDVILRSEREDWILDFLLKGMGVSVVPESSVTSKRIDYRPVEGMTSRRKLKLLYTKSAATQQMAAFSQAAQSYSWV